MSLTFTQLPFWMAEHAGALARGDACHAAACVDRMSFVVQEQLCQASSDERHQPLTQLKSLVVSGRLPFTLLQKLASATFEGPDGFQFQIIPELIRTSMHINEDRDLACLQQLVDAGGNVRIAFTGCVPQIHRASVLHTAAANLDVAPRLIVQMVDWGADLHALTPCGRTPADVASGALNAPVSELLRTYLARDACQRSISDNERHCLP